MLNTLTIMQHHDAITGTHLLNVGQDYSKRIRDARKDFLKKIGGIFNERLYQAAKISGYDINVFEECKLNGL